MRPIGSPKTKGSGRQKGTPNKKTLDAQAQADKLGINPFEILLLHAAGNWQELGYNEDIPIDIRVRCVIESCQYLHPKRKALEGSITILEPERPLEHLTDEELEDLE